VSKKWNLGFTVLLLAAIAISRTPGLMPLNFSFVYALVFCAGAFPQRLPWWLVLVTMLCTDIGLNLFYYHTDAFSDYQAVNYLAYAALYFLGRKFLKTTSIFKLMGGGLLGAVLFYVITNTAAWLQNPEYAKTLAGWIKALTVGTDNWPQTWTFFRNTLISGGLFTGIISALIKMLEASEPEPEPEEEKEESTETETEEKEA
jgi:hypothetical protein